MGSGRDDGNVRVAALTTEFISFTVADEQYGVDIMVVREIKDWSAITRLPHQSDYMRGVLNLRGVIVPIIDLRCRFGNGLTDATPMHVIIVIRPPSAGLSRRQHPATSRKGSRSTVRPDWFSMSGP